MTDWRIAVALEQLRAEINAAAPERSKASDGGIGDAAHSARSSHHNPCACCRVVAARDFTHDPKRGFDADLFTDWLRSRVVRGEETRVAYVIWSRKIFSGPGQGKTLGLWRPYTGTNPHTKHVHVSVRHGAAFYDDPAPWHWPPKEEP